MECMGYTQIVQGPTHCSGGTLDIIFLKKDDFDIDDVTSSVKVHDLSASVGSDHAFIEFDIPFKVPCVQKQLQLHYRDFQAIHVDNFREELNSELIIKAIADLNHDEALEHLNSSLVKVINKQAPMVIKKRYKEKKRLYNHTNLYITTRTEESRAQAPKIKK